MVNARVAVNSWSVRALLTFVVLLLSARSEHICGVSTAGVRPHL